MFTKYYMFAAALFCCAAQDRASQVADIQTRKKLNEASQEMLDAAREGRLNSSAYGQLYMLENFLNQGADINAQAETLIEGHATALIFGVKNGTHMIEPLLKKGANPNIQDSYGMTALMYVAQSNNGPECVKLLLEYGADPYLQNNEGKTAFDLAQGHPAPEKVLKRYEEYRKDVTSQATEALGSITDLGGIVSEYVFPSSCKGNRRQQKDKD